VWSCTAQGIARIGPHELSFGPSSFDADSVIPYANITKIGYYTNGLRVDQGYKRLLLSAEAAPALFVALRHLTPTARVTSGLIVPTGFIDRCSKNGYNIDVSQMRKNPPQTWAVESKEYKPPSSHRLSSGTGL
jgi:hypothetical protein